MLRALRVPDFAVMPRLCCRMTDRDMVIGGYRVPKGTPISLPPYCLHTDAANFDQPLRFWPERWTQPAVSAEKPVTKGKGTHCFNTMLLLPAGLGASALSLLEQLCTCMLMCRMLMCRTGVSCLMLWLIFALVILSLQSCLPDAEPIGQQVSCSTSQ